MNLLNKRKNLICIPLVLALTSCSATAKKTDLSKVKTNTYISANCLISSNTAPADRGLGIIIASTLIPLAIDWAIDQFTDKLTEVKKEESKSQTELYLYKYDPKKKKYPQWNDNFGCITSVTGVFEKDSLEGSIIQNVDYTTTVKLSDSSKRDKKVIERLNDNKIKIKSSNIFSIYESKIEFSEDVSAFKFVSQYLDFKKLLSTKRSTELVYSYEFVGPGLTPDSETYASAALNFGTVKPNTVFTPGKFSKSKETGWIRKVGMTNDSLLSFLSQYDVDDNSKIKNYTPIKFKVVNLQTNKPSDGAKLVAAILGKAKETISSEAVKAWVPKDKGQQKKDLLDAKISLATSKVSVFDAQSKSKDHQALAELQKQKACDALKELNSSATCD